jgi:predicted RNA-binding Zn-ribbon protein involved in translation (DUF1610 family)
MSQDLVVIARFRDLPVAGLAQSILEEAGIWCALDNQYTVGINWLYSNALGGVGLRVMAADAQRARELLRTRLDTTSPAEVADERTAAEPVCPRCGSRNIRSINDKRRFAALSLLLSLPLLVFGKRRCCEDCGYKWKGC